MFCPLCHAEYREGFTRCSTCHAALVAGDASESERKPPRMKFVTHNRGEADEVFSRLYEAGIACLEKAQTDFFSVHVTRRRPTITLYILERDATAARQAAGVEFASHRPEVEIPEGAPVQDCPFCAAKFPAGQTLCPACRGDLLDWNPDDPEAPPPAGASPSDKEPGDAAPDEGEAQLVWRGGDPVVFSRAVEALRESDIAHYTNQTAQHLAFGEAMPRPKLEIFVAAPEAARAREMVAEFQDSFPLVPQQPLRAPEPESNAEALAPGPLDAIAEPPPEEATFAARRSKLRWGGGLFFLSFFLWAWTMRAEPFWFSAPTEFFAWRGEPIRRAAVLLLFYAGFLAGILALLLLGFAWAGRRDKVGLLALFFGLHDMFLLASYFWLLRG